MKYLRTPFLFFFLSFFFPVLSYEDIIKEPKVLVLIAASDDLPVYVEEQQIWRSYMHLDREHFEVYFIKANPELETDYEISSDVIWSKVENNLSTGMVHRVISSIEAMMPKMEEFDYVLRTNLSSFFIFPRYLKFINTLPRTNCYCGVIGYVEVLFVSGAGFLLSRDLAKQMVNDKEYLIEPSPLYWEDLIIGKYFYDLNVPFLNSSRMDFVTLSSWMEGKNFIPEHIHHIRTKNVDGSKRLSEEIFIQKELVNMFYVNPTN
jgi:hypothetical protein